jgi:hypothetical protein
VGSVTVGRFMFDFMSRGIWVLQVRVVRSDRWEWWDLLGAGQALPYGAVRMAFPLFPAAVGAIFWSVWVWGVVALGDFSDVVEVVGSGRWCEHALLQGSCMMSPYRVVYTPVVSQSPASGDTSFVPMGVWESQVGAVSSYNR